MKTLLLSLVLSLPGAGDPFAEGLRHYAAGEYAEAVAAFREALESNPDDPRLNYNLALALWRIGAMEAAETAAEKAAALSRGRLEVRRDGILGNIRYDQARAVVDTRPSTAPVPQPGGKAVQPGRGPDLQKALDLVGQAKTHFLRGATASQPADPVLLRNLERAIRFEEELKKRQQEQKDQQKKDDQQKPDDKQDQGDKKDDKNQQEPDPKADQDKKDKQQPEPDPKAKKDEQKPPQPEEDDGDKKPREPQDAQEAPGEHDPDKQLTPEQRRQLLKRLEEFEQNLQKLKAARKASRPKVKKDW